MAQITDGSFFEQVSRAFRAHDADAGAKDREAAHVRAIQLIYHAIARGAFDESLQLMTDDMTLEICGPDSVPFCGKWHGKDAVLAAMRENFGQLENQRPQIQTVVAQGDIVIVTAREQGTVRTTGKPYDVQWMQEFTFADGKVQAVRELVDRDARFG